MMSARSIAVGGKCLDDQHSVDQSSPVLNCVKQVSVSGSLKRTIWKFVFRNAILKFLLTAHNILKLGTNANVSLFCDYNLVTTSAI